MSPLVERLTEARVVPVVRATDASAALALAERLVDAGHTVLELTATTRGWPRALEEARRRWPGVMAGAGTLRTARDAESAIAAGAEFLVTPWPSPAVREVAERRGAELVEGGFTPVEVAAASARGPAKLFPAHLGGPAYVRSLLAVLPDAAIVPTGGVQLNTMNQYLEAGAVAVGMNAERLVPEEGEQQ